MKHAVCLFDLHAVDPTHDVAGEQEEMCFYDPAHQ